MKKIVPKKRRLVHQTNLNAMMDVVYHYDGVVIWSKIVIVVKMKKDAVILAIMIESVLMMNTRAKMEDASW